MREVRPPSPASRPRRPGSRYFRVLGSILIVAVLVLFVRWLLLRTHNEPNETSAIQTMRTIATAEVTYNSTFPANGYTCSLASLGGDAASGTATAHAAQLIDPALAATGQKSGYTFAIACTAKVTIGTRDVNTSYKITAVPTALGKSGNRGFCLNDTGDLKYDPKGGANCTKPLQ
jgi:type IV pilus assembly protein PilA